MLLWIKKIFSKNTKNINSSKQTKQQNTVKNIKKIKISHFEEIEEKLINADVNYTIIQSVLAKVDKKQGDYQNQVKNLLLAMIEGSQSDFFEIFNANISAETPFVVLFFGVNGSGKTTTIGKIAHNFSANGKKTILAACDTFRTAATEQLAQWHKRCQMEFHGQFGEIISIETMQKANEDPSAVCHRAIKRGFDEQVDCIIVDTSGRLHTNQNLMNELTKLQKTANKFGENIPHLNIMVIDGSNGASAVRQVEDFSKFVKIDGIIATKLDSSSKAGSLFTIVKDYGKKIFFITNGESAGDIKPFVPQDFVNNLFE